MNEWKLQVKWREIFCGHKIVGKNMTELKTHLKAPPSYGKLVNKLIINGINYRIKHFKNGGGKYCLYCRRDVKSE